MRLDKFLKVSRVIKRRTVANDAADNGRVFVNGKQVKPSYEIKVGDVVEIKFGDKLAKFEVLIVPEKQVKNVEELISLLPKLVICTSYVILESLFGKVTLLLILLIL